MAIETGLVPPGPVRTTFTWPTPGGATAVIWVSLSMVKLTAGVVPNLTEVTPLKLQPVMVTVVSPVGLPWVGLMDVIAGLVPPPTMASGADPEAVPAMPLVLGSVTVTVEEPPSRPQGTTKLPLIADESSGAGGL